MSAWSLIAVSCAQLLRPYFCGIFLCALILELMGLWVDRVKWISILMAHDFFIVFMLPMPNYLFSFKLFFLNSGWSKGGRNSPSLQPVPCSAVGCQGGEGRGVGARFRNYLWSSKEHVVHGIWSGGSWLAWGWAGATYLMDGSDPNTATTGQNDWVDECLVKLHPASELLCT